MPSDPNSTRRKVIIASLITILGIFGSRVLGLYRIMILSSQFGASSAGALRAAFDLPDLVLYLVAGGALRTGFVPVFTDLLHKGESDPAQRERAWWLFSALVTMITLLSGLLVVVFEIFAETLMIPVTGRLTAEGFTDAELDLAVRLTRIMLPAQIFMLAGGLLTAALNSLKHFTVPALVPGFYNLCIIVAMLWFGHQFDVASAAYGVLFGAVFGHLLWQVFALARYGRPAGMWFRPQFAWRDELVLRVLQVALPIMLGLCVAEINLKISGWVVAQFGAAARAWFDNASRIARLPDGVFGAGLGIALFPFLSQLAAEGKMAEFVRQSEYTLRLAVVCTMPCAVLLVVAAHPIIALLFGRGLYTANDVAQTAAMLPLFALGVVPITIQVVLTRAFYAQEDSVTPLKVGIVAVLFGIVANLTMAEWIGVQGPALALALTSLLNTVGLVWCYRDAFGFQDTGRLWLLLYRTGAGSAVAGLVAWLAIEAVPAGWPRLHLTQCLVATLSGGVVYAMALRLLRVEEAQDVGRLIARRFARKK